MKQYFLSVSWLYWLWDCMDAEAYNVFLGGPNFSLATSCEHASYKCISKRWWFTGLEGKWLRVTDERAKATSLKTAPVYINIYLMCVKLTWVCASVITPEPESTCARVCVNTCVCMYPSMCVHALNATILVSKLLMQTTVEQKSINNTRVHSKKWCYFSSKSGREMEGGATLEKSQKGYF